MRRLGVWLVGFVAAATAAVMAAAPDASGRAPETRAVPAAATARIPERPRDMAAAIALLDQIRP